MEEHRQTFLKTAKKLARDRRPKARRLEELQSVDAATAIMELRVCDPAMGSGHFLVTLVDYLADAALEAMAESESAADWTDKGAPYQSPLASRIEALRAHILEQAEKHNWIVSIDQLDDRLLIRRIILKRVIHGVDLNPMAVELAKVSLWLHTFTAGAPLSFLDRHLRCGDSLYGEWVYPVKSELTDRFGLGINAYILQAMNAAQGMKKLGELSEIDIGEVKDSAKSFLQVMEQIEHLCLLLDLRQAMRWLGAPDLSKKNLPQALEQMFNGALGDTMELSKKGMAEDDGNPPELKFFQKERGESFPIETINLNSARLVGRSREIARAQRFLHWQVAFPDIWQGWDQKRSFGGFDAVIGNPPWDRMKLQEVEWFAARKPKIAKAATAAKRKAMIRQLYKTEVSLVREYTQAKWAAETATRVARKQGNYPLLSRGDINLYSLFVERAFSLISPKGMVGLLTPSGIAGDKNASKFFKGTATTGRLATLYDFENRRPPKPHYFPDIDSRFKFCIFVAGGEKRRF